MGEAIPADLGCRAPLAVLGWGVSHMGDFCTHVASGQAEQGLPYHGFGLSICPSCPGVVLRGWSYPGMDMFVTPG